MGSEAAKALGAAGANVTLAGTNVAVLEELCALPDLTGRSTIVARRPDELADAVDFLGADLTAGSSSDTSAVRLHTPVARLADAVPLIITGIHLHCTLQLVTGMMTCSTYS
jgi:NAD(P)-dependent dehydrogenase (short-subunit alcohol dehydrogenase family)